LAQTKNKDFLGIFLVSSSAVAFEVIHFPGYEESVVNFITLGGHLEVYFIIRGTAQEIISRYQNIVGKSQMLPYYALGVFQSSKGDPKGLQTLIKKYKDNIPTLLIEGYQIDNYYPKEQIFTVTDDATLKAVNTDLKNNKQKLLLGISAHFNADA
jgi:alpha-glucosidase (family GH31 glycosyl hydrolase)